MTALHFPKYPCTLVYAQVAENAFIIVWSLDLRLRESKAQLGEVILWLCERSS
jgi:hypothetical protein